MSKKGISQAAIRVKGNEGILPGNTYKDGTGEILSDV